MSACYILRFACVSHYAHRFADIKRNLITARRKRFRASDGSA